MRWCCANLVGTSHDCYSLSQLSSVIAQQLLVMSGSGTRERNQSEEALGI